MLLSTTLLSVLIPILFHSVHSQKWKYNTILDGNGTYHLYWNPPDDITPDSEITFRVEVKAKGYVGLGFSPNGGMPGSDIVVGWIKNDTNQQRTFFKDRNAKKFGLPGVDQQQDYQLIDAYENGTHTVLEFSRKLVTCDPDDWEIDESTVRVIYAYSDDDPEGNDPFYHGKVNRGAKSVILLGTKTKNEPVLDLSSMSTWEIVSPDVDFSSTDTLYWCKIYQSPEVSEKQHIVYTQINIQEEHVQFVHHMVLFECIGEPAEDYKKLLDDKGYECYSPEMPVIMYKCQTTIATWGVGGLDVAFPEHVGFPIDEGPVKYHMLEIHYDNQQLVNAGTDHSGLTFYYTPNLRPNDLGLLVAGASISPRTIIPPRQNKYIVVGHGDPDCAGTLFPETGVKAIGVFLHSHLLARAMKVRRFRGNQELKPLFDDKYYDFNYQAYRYFPEEMTVLPNDLLSIECTFNSTERPKTTHGGLSTREEMCEIALLYYPRVSKAVAYSAATFENINKALNINVSNDEELLSALDNYDWESTDIQNVQNILRYSDQETQCYYTKPLDEDEEYQLIGYPSDFEPYEQQSSCNDTDQSTDSTDQSTESTVQSTESTVQSTESTEESTVSTTTTTTTRRPNIIDIATTFMPKLW